MNVQEAFLKYKTLSRIVKSASVPLSVKLGAVVYANTTDNLDSGVAAIASIARTLYPIAFCVLGSREKAMEACSIAINDAAEDHHYLNK